MKFTDYQQTDEYKDSNAPKRTTQLLSIIDVSGTEVGTIKVDTNGNLEIDSKVNNLNILGGKLFLKALATGTDGMLAIKADGEVYYVSGELSNYLDKATYDSNDNGIVDDSEKVNGLTVQTAVPAGAVFTDTVYDDTPVTDHIANKANPHTVTKAQVGLGNVDNTSDADKPISTATQTALDGKVDNSRVLTDVPANAVFTDTIYDDSDVLKDADLGITVQEQLVSGTNIKTINNESILGSGNIEIAGGSNGGSFKNKIVNATFDIWQEFPGKDITGDNTTRYAADLFKYYLDNGSIQITEGEIDGSRSLKHTVTSPSTDLTGNLGWYILWYVFEGIDLYTAAKQQKSITLSFKFKASKAGVYSISLRHKYTDSYVSEFTVNTPDTVESYNFTIPLNHTWTDALANDNNIGFSIVIGSLATGDGQAPSINQWEVGSFVSSPNAVDWSDTAGNYIEIAEPQLEVGDSATDFEYIPENITLQSVKRYYQKYIYAVWATLDFFSFHNAGSLAKGTKQLDEILRAVPTVSIDNFSTLSFRGGGDIDDVVAFGPISDNEIYIQNESSNSINNNLAISLITTSSEVTIKADARM